MIDFDFLLLQPIEEVLGEAMLYVAPNTLTAVPITGVWGQEAVALDEGADAAGGFQAYRKTLFVRDADFPVPGGIVQGGAVTRAGKVWSVADIRSDGVGGTTAVLALRG